MGYGFVAAKEAHVGALVRLSAALFAEDAGTRDPLTDVRWPEKHGWEHFSGLVRRDDAKCFLAFSGQTPVGYLAGLMHAPTTIRPVGVAELQSMYVVPEHRGCGIGGNLVERFRFWARERGAGRTSVSAYAANKAAVRFYEQAGFRPATVSLEAGL